MKQSDIKEAIVLPNYGSDIQIVGIKTNVPITTDIFYWRGKPYIVDDQLEWDGYLYNQRLIAMKGETAFHIHRFYNGICYLCGHHINSHS